MSAPNSTIDRSTEVRPPGPAGLRRTFAVLERHWPTLGGRLAEHLWFRPPPPSARAAREARTPPGGEPFEVTWGGGTVRGRVYGDWGNPTAYLVHGWGGWWQQLAAHVESLQAAGMCVVAFDLPSHGSSGPGRVGRRSTHLIEMAEALAAVTREFGRPTLVVAHSAGCMATVHAWRYGVVADAYAFIAPAHAVEPMISGFSAVLGIGPRSRQSLRRRIERRADLPLTELDLVAAARTLTTPSALLVVHDRQDPQTPAAGSVALSDAWPGSDLLLTERLGHHRVIWEPVVVERVAALAATAAEHVRRSSR